MLGGLCVPVDSLHLDHNDILQEVQEFLTFSKMSENFDFSFTIVIHEKYPIIIAVQILLDQGDETVL